LLACFELRRICFFRIAAIDRPEILPSVDGRFGEAALRRPTSVDWQERAESDREEAKGGEQLDTVASTLLGKPPKRPLK
jgi:hypothetical protein